MAADHNAQTGHEYRAFLRACYALIESSALVAFIAMLILLTGRFADGESYYNWSARVWARRALGSSGAKLRLLGRNRVPKGVPCFYAGNHQSALDIPILMIASKGTTRFMAKHTLFQIPLFGWILKTAGHAAIDRSNARKANTSLQQMSARLREHPTSFSVFPEGTRGDGDKLLPFRPGAMKICKRSGMPIVPFAIHGSAAVHKSGRFRLYAGPITFVYGRPIAAEQAAKMTSVELSELVRKEVDRCLAEARSVS